MDTFKFWRLFIQNEQFTVSHETPSAEELKILHKTIKKTSDDIESMSFNTSVSAFIVCVNELGTLKCNKIEILKPLLDDFKQNYELLSSKEKLVFPIIKSKYFD